MALKLRGDTIIDECGKTLLDLNEEMAWLYDYALHKKTNPLTYDTNFDDVVDPGYYVYNGYSGGSTGANRPTDTKCLGFLIVMKNEYWGNICQVFFTSNKDFNGMYRQKMDGAWKSWIPIGSKFQEVELLAEGTYTADELTLKDSLANYSRVTIFYKQTGYFGGTHKSVTIENPNGKKVNLNEMFYIDTYNGSTYYGGYLLSRVYELSGKTMTVVSRGNQKFYGTNSTGTWGIGDTIAITKVVGYK